MSGSVITLHGHSMFPAIQDQDQLSIHFYDKPVSVEEVAEGKVVLLKDSSEWMIHRVVLQGDIKKTKGDWSVQFDESNLIWGEVLKVNGKASAILVSQKMGEYSSKINLSQVPWQRKFTRVKMIFYVFLLKLFKRNS